VSSGQEHPALLALGNAVRRRREARGLTVNALSAEANVSRGMILALEHGTRNVGILTIIEVASALGVHPAELLAEAIPQTD
jgi:transcriptional regulator with XRE-family HTH domain